MPAHPSKARFTPSFRTLLRTGLVAGALGLAACSGGSSSQGGTTPPPAENGGGSGAQPAADANKDFAALSASYIERLFALDPNLATQSGEHKHDGRWPDVSAAGTAAMRAFYAETKQQLEALDEAKLDDTNRVDRKILLNQVNYALFTIDELRPLERNPLLYVGLLGDGLDPLLTREFAPVEQRMASLAQRLDGVPAIVAAAKAPGQKAAVLAAAQKATAALTELATFFEKELLPRSDGDFRIGRALFEKKLRYELADDVDIDAVAAEAHALLASTTEEMVATSVELWPTLFGKMAVPKHDTLAAKKALVKRVLAKVAEDRPTNATILAEAKKLLEETTAFVREKDLVRVPDEKCDVIEMPEYRRGVAVAYCESSGPFEAKPETYYAISPTPKDWSKARADSFYKEYNRAMLVELTIHEAMPGHYLQAMHNNRFPSKLRALYGSGPFVEGWAVYGEWVMAKYGMGGPKVRLQRQKMVLRLCANAILDHDIHAGTMDEKQALALMQDDAFQEEGEAVGKWKRARLSSAQLTTYFYGFSEFMKLRTQLETAPGFTERAYHDRILSFGAPPMKLLREIMTSGR